MASTKKWVAGAVTFSSGNAIAGTALNALANGSGATGSAITSNVDQYAHVQLDCKFQANPSANGVVDLYLLPSVDGTNYAEPTLANHVGSCPVDANTSAQIKALFGILIPLGNYKWRVVNNSGQTMTANDTDNKLSYLTVNEQIV